MNKVPGKYWQPEPSLSALIQQESLRLNPQPPSNPLERLKALRSDDIGGLLVVTQQFAPDGVSTEPYITIVAAPSLATLGILDAAHPPGLVYSEFWDEEVLASYALPAAPGPHCPFMAAAEGFSRKVKLPGIVDLLTDSQPLFFAHGKQTAAIVPTTSGVHYRAFYLPEVCGMPLGLVWPTTIGYENFLASIQCLRSDYNHFLQVLVALQPQLAPWFSALQLDPIPFTTPSVPFLMLYDKGFPAVETGESPDLIVDVQAFSPLQEMMHGYLWRLTCDGVLATGTPDARRLFAVFLARGETAITPASYFGANIPGRFCPNFAYHFKVANDWPTRVNPLTDLASLFTVSARAQEYDPITIDLHIDVHPEIQLHTHDQASAEAHRLSTPRYSAAPAAAPPTIFEPVTEPAPPLEDPEPISQDAIFPQGYPPRGSYDSLHLPAPATLYSPPTRQLEQHQFPSGPPAPHRSLSNAFSASMHPAASFLPPVTRTSDPTIASIVTEQGRNEASQEFLNCCRLLAHHDTRSQLIDSTTGQRLSPQANLFPRQPTSHFRRDVLGPLFQGQKGYQASVYNYIEALLNRSGVPVESLYAQEFFTAERIRALYSVESWSMSPQTQNLASLPSQTFHVYSLVQCIPDFRSHPNLLPTKGLSALQAKSIGAMAHLLFAMIDMKPDFMTSTFDASVLGTRLQLWCNLPGLLPINRLWEVYPAAMTFYWFESLRELLSIFHCWVKAHRFHMSQGFVYAKDSQGNTSLVLADTLPSHIPGQSTTLMDALARSDLQFQHRWYTQAYNLQDALWSAPPPSDHFVRPVAPIIVPPTDPAPAGVQGDRALKRQKLGKAKKPANFFCQLNLLEAIEPLPAQKAAITTILHRLPTKARFPLLPDSNGTLSYICFKSCFPPPHDRCNTEDCRHTKSNPPVERLHIDLSVARWKNQPEAYWKPVVDWLLLPGVAKHFVPSVAFKSMTPATAWS